MTTLNVNETRAKVSWKVVHSSRYKLQSKPKYKILLMVNDTMILNEDVPYGSATKTFQNLRPGTKYEVIITERFEMSRSNRTFRHAFETNEIGKRYSLSTVTVNTISNERCLEQWLSNH